MSSFVHIHADTYRDDAPLDTFLLGRNRANLGAHIAERPVSGTWSAYSFNASTGALVLPEVSGYRQPSLLAFPFPLPPRTTELEIEIEHQVATTVTALPHTSEVKAYATVMGLGAWISREQSRRLTQWVTSDVTGGATAPVTTALTFDVSTIPEGWAVAVVGIESGEGGWSEIETVGGSIGDAFTGWWPGYYLCANAASHTLGTGNAVPHQVVQLADAGRKRPAFGGAPLFDNPRRVLFLEDDGSGDRRYRLHVHPPIYEPIGSEAAGDPDATHQAADGLWVAELGVSQIHGITIHTKTTAALPDVSARLDAPQPASVRVPGPEVAEQARTWLTRPRIHTMGPQPLLSQSDWTGHEPVNRITGSVELGAAWKTLAMSPIGSDDAFKRRGRNDAAATEYVKTAVETCFAFCSTLPSDGANGPWGWNLEFRLRCADRDAAANIVDADWSARPSDADPADNFGLILENVLTIPSPASRDWNGALANFGELGLLLGFNASNDDPHVLERHGLAGVLPLNVLRASRTALNTQVMSIVDTNTGAHRVLLLQVRAKDGGAANQTSGGVRSEYAPRIHLVTWTAASQSFLGAEPPVSAVGVAT